VTAPVLDPVKRPAPPRRTAAAPHLTVVRPGPTPAQRRRRARLALFVITAAAALCLFGVVVAHVVLTQNQFRLDQLQDQAAERQAEYDRLRLQVAELESPDRIVATAQQRLGMVAPPGVTYLAPTLEDEAVVPGAPSTTRKAAGDAATGAGWSTVKPHLAEG
jgi:cell division protein FtsL